MEQAAVSLPLPDDLLLEILVRLKDDMAALFRCAMVCKLWHRLVANPSFLRRCWPEDTSASIVGFFARVLRPGQWVEETCFVPAPRSVMGRGCRALTTFLQPTGHDLDQAEPLVSRHGLLLVRLPNHGMGLGVVPQLHLAVCNLLVGECHVLPSLNCAQVYTLWNGYAVLSGADICPQKHNEQRPASSLPSFKVAIMDFEHNLYTFSSDEGSWSMATRCFGGEATIEHTPAYYGPAVVCRGTAHWLFNEWRTPCLCIVNMDAKTGHVSLTRIQVHPNRHPCLTVSSNGSLSLIYIKRKGADVEIWEIVDETAKRLCTRSIELQEPGTILTPRISSLYMIAEKYGTLIAQVSSMRVYVVDLETETVDELVDWPQRHRDIADRVELVPLQMSWLTFFLSRLGSR